MKIFQFNYNNRKTKQQEKTKPLNLKWIIFAMPYLVHVLILFIEINVTHLNMFLKLISMQIFLTYSLKLCLLLEVITFIVFLCHRVK